jgi:signal transduction histidine kinase
VGIIAVRSTSRRTVLVDVAAVVLVVVVAQLDVWTGLLGTDINGPSWLACLVLTVLGLLLVLRRGRPFAMVIAICALVLAWWLVEGTPPVASAATIAFLIAAYSVGRWETNHRRAVAGAGLISVVLVIHLLGQPGVTVRTMVEELPWDLLLLGTWLLGTYLRYRNLYVEQLQESAVQAERIRIARELHDVVAHGVSVMVIQAEAAEELLSHHDDARASSSLRIVQETGRQTLTDLRATLGSLRAGAETEWTPGPGLTQIESLATQVRAAGIEVTVVIRGDVRALSRTLNLVAYRVVQEALTNILKHSAASTVRVVLTYREQILAVEVLDNGPARSVTTVNSGIGLLGMRERVASVRGHLETGPGSDGGYGVHAQLPIPETVPT